MKLKSNMGSEFVTYGLAFKLKAIGFDEPCFAWHVSEGFGLSIGNVIKSDLIKDAVLAPTWQSAFRWFRDNHHAFHEVFIDCLPKVGVPLEEDLMFSFTIHLVKEDKLVCGPRDTYRTQEEAEFACLEKLIEIVEQK